MPNQKIAESIVTGILKEVEDAGDRVYLSDLIIAEQQQDYAPEPLLARLRDDPQRIYTLLCLCDQYGQPVRPGDKVKRWYKKPLYRNGEIIPLREQNTAVLNGTWKQDFERFEEYTVDRKGCITTSAADAELYFLTHFGIHGTTGARMSFHPERSGPKVTDPVTGETKMICYWRFKEVDKAQYDALPDLTSQSQPSQSQQQGQQQKSK